MDRGPTWISADDQPSPSLRSQPMAALTKKALDHYYASKRIARRENSGLTPLWRCLPTSIQRRRPSVSRPSSRFVSVACGSQPTQTSPLNPFARPFSPATYIPPSVLSLPSLANSGWIFGLQSDKRVACQVEEATLRRRLETAFTAGLRSKSGAPLSHALRARVAGLRTRGWARS